MSWEEKYERYLERYCKTREITKEEAETHAIVKEVKEYYQNDDNETKVVGWKEEKLCV